jgi:hypothetical protein
MITLALQDTHQIRHLDQRRGVGSLQTAPPPPPGPEYTEASIILRVFYLFVLQYDIT